MSGKGGSKCGGKRSSGNKGSKNRSHGDRSGGYSSGGNKSCGSNTGSKNSSVLNILLNIGVGTANIRIHFDGTSHVGIYMGISEGSVILNVKGIITYIKLLSITAVEVGVKQNRKRCSKQTGKQNWKQNRKQSGKQSWKCKKR
ncbi:hypothetical protein [Paenibacillus sinopodophylli]|uniref:hypothetical protein n=1 Tax=Paenibacillus sinopodophylli TaxID=1837342 RepID=UPI00110CC72B|nr:hypothetical protein [Paenibacillus sinopodophylli]